MADLAKFRALARTIHEAANGTRTGGAGNGSRGACVVGPPRPVRSSESCDRAENVLLETRYRDLDDMVGIYETFAREIRSKV
jgi:hypothetical protein